MSDRPRDEARPETDDERAAAHTERKKQPDEKRTKPESEMRRGKDHPWELPEPLGEYDPATRRTPQEGGPD